jgi:hypothetical protein
VTRVPAGRLEGPFPKMGHPFIKQEGNNLCMACGHLPVNHVEEDAAATMDKLDLEAIEARWKAASRGPWYSNGYCGIFTDSPAAAHGIASIWEDRIAGDTPTKQGDANREFITSAHADIPALIAENRVLRAKVESLEARLGRTAGDR